MIHMGYKALLTCIFIDSLTDGLLVYDASYYHIVILLKEGCLLLELVLSLKLMCQVTVDCVSV